MRSEILGTYDVLLVRYGTKWKNDKIGRVLAAIFCHLVYPCMPFRLRRFGPYMTHAFINPYIMAAVSFGVTGRCYGFVCYLLWYLTIFILGVL